MLVAWDVDDVLNDLMRTWLTESWLPSHPNCELRYSDIVENPPDRVLGIPKAEYLASLDSFRASEAARRMTPNPAVLGWLSLHGPRCRHVALTARPIESIPYAAEWVFRHFGAYVRMFGAVPSRGPAGSPTYDHTKGEFLQWLGTTASVLVDDSVENVAAAQQAGLQAILYPRPWNGNRGTVDDALDRLFRLVVAQ